MLHYVVLKGNWNPPALPGISQSQFATRLLIPTLSSVIKPEVLFKRIFADVLYHEPEVLVFQTAARNGYGEVVSAAQTLGLQEGCSEKNELHGLFDQLSAPSSSRTLSR